jgi:hypothetical protein
VGRPGAVGERLSAIPLRFLTPRRISWIASLLSLVGLLWATVQGLFTLAVLQSDETGGACDAPEPALAAAASLAVVLALASFGFALAPRNDRLALALGAELALSVVWLALGGMPAAGCVIE